MQTNFAISFITIALIVVVTSEDCHKCVHKEKCLPFKKLDQKAQDAWIAKYPCSAAKGDFVCCSNGLLNKSNERYVINVNGNQGGQCSVTSFPPLLQSGCCGREATPRSARIVGGHETGFTQFPWAVLLKVTFDYGNRRATIICGGSLISSRYVLTAGHCVYSKGGQIVDLDVYLAEYDKRTFPIDCKNIPGEGRICIENMVMKAEHYILHPQYEDSQLKNDIALIRLKGYAPYTDYIRPICLPSINIDTPQFSNLRLAVTGWGLNGRFRSDVKESTVVNLIPQNKCRASYPALTRGNLCAAGYSGEDACKGDDGGPLMMFYDGKYEVVGIVSGKRADSPCGSSVPTLYTNVYQYLDWIRNNIRN